MQSDRDQPVKVLILDDEAAIRDILRRWFEKEGFSVREAENGRDGLQLQRQDPARILICDLIMPVQEGIETITQFRREFPEVCIIAISGGGRMGPDSYLDVARHLGAWKTFRKPVDIPAMIACVREWLSNHDV